MELTSDEATWLEEAAGACGLDWRQDYSGRFMYGKRCVGVVGDNVGRLLAFVVDVADIEIADGELKAALTENVSTDNMGLDTIWYWPSVQVAEDE